MSESPAALSSPRPMSYRVALRAATPFPLLEEHVVNCLLDDPLFRKAWTAGAHTLTPEERRGRLCVDTGTIAESVTTLLLVDAGFDVFAELASPGVHGVDMLVLTPRGTVVAVEVKGTFRAGSIPALGRGRLRQMSLEWLSSPDNPAMVEWELEGADVYGAIIVIDFAERQWRMATTSDYEGFDPLFDLDRI
jgi:hypothetical protein